MSSRDKRTVAVIPARGGSKGLSRKNIRLLGRKPLMAWTIEAARECPFVDRVIVSTDNEEIAHVAEEFGAEIPFLRPAALAQDHSLTEDVLKHAIEWMDTVENDRYDILLYLQITEPFRKNHIVHQVVQTLIADENLETVFAGCPDHKNYWEVRGEKFIPMDSRGHSPRQQKQHIYREDTGVACATRVSVVRRGKRIGKRVKIIPFTPEPDIDIHNELDLAMANFAVNELGLLPNG